MEKALRTLLPNTNKAALSCLTRKFHRNVHLEAGERNSTLLHDRSNFTINNCEFTSWQYSLYFPVPILFSLWCLKKRIHLLLKPRIDSSSRLRFGLVLDCAQHVVLDNSTGGQRTELRPDREPDL